MKTRLLLSCEHASAAVPVRYRRAFRGAAAALRSHRGIDFGAAQLARQFARDHDAELFAATATRLLADTNRSARHPNVLSEWSRRLDEDERARVMQRHWQPHRDRVTGAVANAIARGERVVHVSVHSFTPSWHGTERTVDVGWLYDPARPLERAFVGTWIAALRSRRDDLRLRRNQPYRGTADGLTTSLRRQFPADRYLGIELEVSQRFPLGAAEPWRRLRAALCATLPTAARVPTPSRRSART